jgi:hypothetical protein
MSGSSDDKIILLAIEEGLNVLGENSKKIFFNYLVTIFKILPGDLVNNMSGFQQALRHFLGQGSVPLEQLIVHYLRGLSNQEFGKDLTLAEIVDVIKNKSVIA